MLARARRGSNVIGKRRIVFFSLEFKSGWKECKAGRKCGQGVKSGKGPQSADAPYCGIMSL
jgi:hypothetical protein